jgi:hypothetical protein
MNTLRYANRVKELRKGALPPSLAGEQPAAPSAGFKGPAVDAGGMDGRRCASPLAGGGGVEEEEDKLARTHEELVYVVRVDRVVDAAFAVMPALSTETTINYNSHHLCGHHGHVRCSYSILDEEDDIIAAHRQQIEDSMEMVQREMVLLQTVEQPGGSVET